MKKILLIEDDQTLRENTKEMLELSGYKVYDTADGRSGLALALQHLPDLIVCDIMMPTMDGYEVLDALGKKEATRYIPFIFLSAKAEVQDIRKGMTRGADDYVTKPFREQDLLSTIESRIAKFAILSRKRNRKEEPVKEQISDLDLLRNYFREKGNYEEVRKSDIIYKEQKNAYYIYMLEDGLVKTHRMDEYGKELITGLYKKGDFFGFYHFKQVAPYPETATVLEAGGHYKLHNREFQKILSQSHKLTIELAQLLSDNLSNLKTHLLEMAYASVLKKTTNTILQFAEVLQDDPAEGIKISRSDLASVAGISTESFIRSLSSLKKEGLIDIEGRNIKVLDLDKLHNIK
ncbi:MAG: response regulator [Salegentibacter sp.]